MTADHLKTDFDRWVSAGFKVVFVLGFVSALIGAIAFPMSKDTSMGVGESAVVTVVMLIGTVIAAVVVVAVTIGIVALLGYMVTDMTDDIRGWMGRE